MGVNHIPSQKLVDTTGLRVSEKEQKVKGGDFVSVLSIEKYTPIKQDIAVKAVPDEKTAVREINIQAKAQQKAEEDSLQKSEGKNSAQKLEEAVEQLNKTVETYNTDLKFTIHDESGRVSVKVIDTRDNSVIREIPSEQALNFAAHVKKMLGIIFDKFI